MSNHARTRRSAVAVAATVLALLITAVPALARTHTIGRASASGGFAAAAASGSATRPRAMYVRVSTRPRQRVRVNWTMVCHKGFWTRSRSGAFTARGRATRKLRMPARRPASCTLSATGQLARGGRLIVSLLAR